MPWYIPSASQVPAVRNPRLTSWVSIIPSNLTLHPCLLRCPVPPADAFYILSSISGCPQEAVWFTLPRLSLRKWESSERFTSIHMPGSTFPISYLCLLPSAAKPLTNITYPCFSDFLHLIPSQTLSNQALVPSIPPKVLCQGH